MHEPIPFSDQYELATLYIWTHTLDLNQFFASVVIMSHVIHDYDVWESIFVILALLSLQLLNAFIN